MIFYTKKISNLFVSNYNENKSKIKIYFDRVKVL